MPWDARLFRTAGGSKACVRNSALWKVPASLLVLMSLIFGQPVEAARASRWSVANVTFESGLAASQQLNSSLSWPPFATALESLLPDAFVESLAEALTPNRDDVNSTELLINAASFIENASLPSIIPPSALDRVNRALNAIGEPSNPQPILDVGIHADPEAQFDFSSQSLGISFPVIANASAVFTFHAGPWALEHLTLTLTYTPLRPVIKGEPLSADTQVESYKLLPLSASADDVRLGIANSLRRIAGAFLALQAAAGGSSSNEGGSVDNNFGANIPGGIDDLNRALPMNATIRLTPFLESESYTLSQLEDVLYTTSSSTMEDRLEASLRSAPSNVMTFRNAKVQTSEQFDTQLASFSDATISYRPLWLPAAAALATTVLVQAARV